MNQTIKPSWTRGNTTVFGLALFMSASLVVCAEDECPGVDTFIADKGTHTTDAGAQLCAACVIVGLESLPENPLAPFYSKSGQAVEALQPRALNISIPNPTHQP